VRGKSRTPPGIDPRTIQVLGSNRYTDWAVLVHKKRRHIRI
jgi:hypothetical protein